MRAPCALALLLGLLALPHAAAQALETDAEELDAAALESTEAARPASLQGASGVLLFTAFGASLGAVIALGRYHKRRRVP